MHETRAIMIDLVIHRYKAPVKELLMCHFSCSSSHTHRDLNTAGTQSTYQLISWVCCSYL